MPDVNEIRLGSINGSHGIKGWVKVFSYTDPLEAILEYTPWILRKGGIEKEIKSISGQASGKRLIVQFEGVENRDQAEDLIGYEVHVNRDVMPDLPEGEFYWYQLEGLTVRNSANDVMVVEPTDDSIDKEQRLIPFVEGEVIKQVDEESGVVTVDWEPDY